MRTRRKKRSALALLSLAVDVELFFGMKGTEATRLLPSNLLVLVACSRITLERIVHEQKEVKQRRQTGRKRGWAGALFFISFFIPSRVCRLAPMRRQRRRFPPPSDGRLGLLFSSFSLRQRTQRDRLCPSERKREENEPVKVVETTKQAKGKEERRDHAPLGAIERATSASSFFDLSSTLLTSTSSHSFFLFSFLPLR